MFEGLKLRGEQINLERVRVRQMTEALSSFGGERLKKSLDDSDSGSWSMLGSAGSRELSVVDADTMRSQAAKLYYTNPHARNIVRLVEKYVVGRGFQVSHRAKVEPLKLWWDEFWKRNKMDLRKKEIVRRGMRDGEVFIRKFRDKSDGMLLIRFMDPGLVLEPAGKTAGAKGDTSFGIETNPEDGEEVWAYWYKGERILAEEVIHRKILVDSDVKRGRSFIEIAMFDLAMYRKWIKDRMKLNYIRSLIGLHRKVKGGTAEVASLAAGYETSKLKAPDGTAKMRVPEGVSVVTTNEGVDYDFKTPNLQAADVATDGRHVLLSVAAGVGLPEYMVTCFDEETEILTEDGWLRFCGWNGERVATMAKDGSLEYQAPTEQHGYHYRGDMVHVQTGTIDLVVTPNHRLLVKTRPELPWKFEAAALSLERGHRWFPISTDGLQRGGTGWSLDGIRFSPEDSAAFLGWYLSEGCVYRRKDRNEVQIIISQFKSAEKIAEIKALLEAMYRRSFIHKKRGQFIVYDRELAEWLSSHCGEGSRSHKLPDIHEMTLEQKRILLSTMEKGDGNLMHNTHRYTTISKELADGVQQLAIELGYTSRITKEKPWGVGTSDVYRVYYRAACDTQALRRHYSYRHYDGVVWCFTTPNGTLVVRRNGRVAITGNSNAENSNMASTLIAEAPGVMEFHDWQDFWKTLFAELYETVVDWGIRAGKLPEFYDEEVETPEEQETEAVNPITGLPYTKKETVAVVSTERKPMPRECDIQFPDIVHRDFLQETNALIMQSNQGWVSDHTASGRLNLDYDDEQEHIARENIDKDEGGGEDTPADIEYARMRAAAIAAGEDPEEKGAPNPDEEPGK